MKRIRELEIVLDADDVLLDCNAYALALLSQKNKTAYDLNRVRDWGLLGIPEDERLTFLQDRSFYTSQPSLPGADLFLKTLMDMAHVTIMTAVYPQFMGERIERLHELFPFFPLDHIVMGHRKDLVRADVMLDDGVHNLRDSIAAFPVLFRQPWNRHVSGICSINRYSEFLSLVEALQGQHAAAAGGPKVVCIVGPSGSGKHELCDALCAHPDFCEIHTCTTSVGAGHNRCLSPEEFARCQENGEFLESTWYCSEQYALPLAPIDQALESGRHAVAVMDISGCMSVVNHYPGQALILYAERDKRSCITSILGKTGLSVDEQTDRILALELEQKNRILADRIISYPSDGDFSKLVEEIRGYCS